MLKACWQQEAAFQTETLLKNVFFAVDKLPAGFLVKPVKWF